MRLLLLLTVWFFTLLFYSCNSGGCPEDEILATYELSEYSTSNLPYNNVDTIVFVNVDTLEKIFTINEYMSFERSQELVETCFSGASIFSTSSHIVVETEILSTSLASDSDTFTISVQSSVLPINVLTEDVTEEDYSLYDYVNVTSKSLSFHRGILAVIDNRNTSQEQIDSLSIFRQSVFLTDTTILDYEIQNIFMSSVIDSSVIFYSIENGIEAFVNEGETWVFDRAY